MRTAVLCLSVVVVGATFAGPAACAETQAKPAPLIEVVSFGVTPVTGLNANAALQPKAGDILHRNIPNGAVDDGRLIVETRVRAGESWIGLIERVNSPLTEMLRAQVGLLPALAPGKYVRAYAPTPERPAEIEYVVSEREAFTISVQGSAFAVTPHPGDPRLIARMRADASKASLFTATDAVGLPESIVLQLVEIFSSEVDFHRELHQGYRCTLVYEVHYRDGHIEHAGRILAAEFRVHDRELQAYYFDGGPGRPGYFTETGRSMRKVFRRSPVEFSRRTSEYTLARFHPILGIWRAHRGTDYAAPVGTPVLATSEGVVEFAGERGDFGNLVILTHFDRYQTWYGHLEGYAPGVVEGAPVEQGQVVGYVGLTGLTTGPHLHYEFRVRDGDGAWVSVPAPEVLEAPAVLGADYFEIVKSYREKLAIAGRAHVVTLD